MLTCLYESTVLIINPYSKGIGSELVSDLTSYELFSDDVPYETIIVPDDVSCILVIMEYSADFALVCM